jgi:hypothetical protein
MAELEEKDRVRVRMAGRKQRFVERRVSERTRSFEEEEASSDAKKVTRPTSTCAAA